VSNLATRIAVAAVAIPLIVLLTFLGGLPFFGMVALISAVALHEFYGLAKAKGSRPQTSVGLLFGICVNTSFLPHGLSPGTVLLGVVLLFVPMLMMLELFRVPNSSIHNVSVTVLGVCYVSVGLGSLVWIRAILDDGEQWGAFFVMTIFASIWICDSMAYFVGRFLGKRPLLQRVSPRKTWEGAVAGFLGAVATFAVAGSMALPFLTLGEAVAFGVIVGLFGQMGDLVESWLKRDASVKDSSTIIPGHGGMLDRFDSLIIVSPLVLLYLWHVLRH
jgi:phosphatidate cytidylyltransferase